MDFEKENDLFKVSKNISPPNLDEEPIVETLNINTNISEQIAGVTGAKTIYLKGVSHAIYPTKNFWYDLDALNTDIFNVRVSSNGVFLQPKVDGLYKIEFYTSVFARKASSLLVRMFELPGNFQLSYDSYLVNENHVKDIYVVRYRRLTPQKSIYVNFNQLNREGDIRVWIGGQNQDEGRSYSGFYISKI